MTSLTLARDIAKNDNFLYVEGTYNFKRRKSTIYLGNYSQPSEVMDWEHTKLFQSVLTLSGAVGITAKKDQTVLATLVKTDTETSTENQTVSVSKDAELGTKSLTVSNAVILGENQTATLSGAGIAEGTTVTASGTTLTLSAATTAAIPSGSKLTLVVTTTTTTSTIEDSVELTLAADVAATDTSISVAFDNPNTLTDYTVGDATITQVSGTSLDVTKITVGKKLWAHDTSTIVMADCAYKGEVVTYKSVTLSNNTQQKVVNFS